MPLRVAMLTPFGPPAVRGNAVTVARVARGLAERGIDLKVWDLSATWTAAIESEVEAYAPMLIHAFHAYRVGPLALRLAQRVEVPLVVTLTGTDANHDLSDPARAPVVQHVLEGASRVTVFHESVIDRVAAVLPGVRAHSVVVPQSVRLPEADPFDLSKYWRLAPPTILFVFPVGLREVKDPIFPLAPLGRLVETIPEIRLLYAGPVIEPPVAATLHRVLSTTTWARHVGEVPHSQMRSLLSQADVVLNCSVSEGGMANSVLEALSLGRAVLASDIEGNRSIVADGSTGFLYRNETEFEQRAALLARDAALRQRLGRAGTALVAERFPPGREIDGYQDVYRELTAAHA
jgi:glycosyltransferase involved in cell wall biosynthesis